jgi:hypothetical protein
MNRTNRRATRPVLLAAVLCGVFSTGCPFGGNVSINAVVPLGLGGSPGAYNPFGIVQALVNSLLGAVLPATGGSGGTGSGTGAPSVAPVDAGTIGVIVSRP